MKEVLEPSERKIDMTSKEVLQLMQRMKYIGSEKLSATQLKKSRTEKTKKFLEHALNYPNWQDRVDEIWIYHGRGGDWTLENWKYADEYK